MSNQQDNNKMASWLKFIVLGVGAAGALYGAVRYILGQQETQQSAQCSRVNSTRRRKSIETSFTDGVQRECEICSETSDEFVIFLPCTHSVACSDCGARMRKCLTCRRPIAERITEDGKAIPYKPPKDNEGVICPICFENKKRIIFNCGHTVCKNCSERLNECPICRETIRTRNNFF